MAAVVDVGYMPPWPAGDGDVAFHGDRRLDDATKATIVDWVEAGGILDVATDTPIVPTGSTDRSSTAISSSRPIRTRAPSTPTRTTTAARSTTPGSPGPPIEAFGFEPDRTEVVHHAVLFAPTPARADAEAPMRRPRRRLACSGSPDSARGETQI